MTCDEFRSRYGELRDGPTTAGGDAARFRRHLAECESCQRFDAAICQGIDALRTATPLPPSSGFRGRLEARLAAERAAWEQRRTPMVLRLAGALLVAVAVTLVASDALRDHRAAAAAPLPPVVFPKPVINPGVPLVTFQDPRATVLAGNTHPYGTAFVGPSATRR